MSTVVRVGHRPTNRLIISSDRLTIVLFASSGLDDDGCLNCLAPWRWYFFPPASLGRQHFGLSISVVSLEPAFTQLFQLAVQSLHPCPITTSARRIYLLLFDAQEMRPVVDFDFLNALAQLALQLFPPSGLSIDR